ncbi:DUF805 domain-containing protein [Flavobacterium jejuense]|uniref:DUF805 domain-containing protein n=1 Tax=Flavobacterium jejuense TaxID=1544455 RepID=A0ABX0IVM8_9FLAO|nr:DUF805 domain-containing protein [Flavobacterium jejuense]NHN26854.1 DUF805 domain-containing protein [Flavobacterium jejuense]
MEKKEQDYNLIDWWKKVVIKNYANFNGRARRKEYWYFVLVNIIISIVLGIIDGLGGLFIGNPENGNGILGSISSLVFLVPSIAVGVRRMHDVGKSGWYLLIPIYNLILACTEGDNGKNEYGDDPKSDISEINEIGTAQE